MRFHTGVKTYIRYISRFPKYPTKKFVVFGRGRSGSTLLVSILNCNPEIYCEGEIFQVKVLFPQLFIKCRPAISEKSVYGFKLLTYQLLDILSVKDPAVFLNDLHKMDFSIIYLKRDNILRQAVSNIYARHINEFHRSSDPGTMERMKIYIDLDQLSRWLTNLERVCGIEEKSLKNLPYLPIRYEDDLESPGSQQYTLDKISEFLQIPSADVRITLKKVTPHDLSDFIENYDELEDFIRSSPYSVYLEGDPFRV